MPGGRRLPALALALVTLAAAPGRAADEGPKVQEIRAVERGWFFASDVGFAMFLTSLGDRSFGPGFLAGMYVGYDVLPMLSLSIGGLAMTADGSEDNPAPKGDLLFVSPTFNVQFAFVTTERNFLWARASVGFGFGLPADVEGAPFGGNGVMGMALVGYERFTKLRHFSLGIQAGAVLVTKPEVGVGLTILPTLKYTF